MTQDCDTALQIALQHADAKLLQVAFLESPEREALLAEVKDHLMHAETLKPGCAAYRLACVSGRMNQTKLCRRWLERAQKLQSLPPKDELLGSDDLKGVRKATWFRMLVKKL